MASGDWKPCPDALSFNGNNLRKVGELEKPFYEEEVFKAFSNFSGDL